MKMEIRRKDVILVCLFTIGFFCIALWGLGSHSIPQTEQELSAREDGAKEVVLYFEEGQQLSDLLLFIGCRAAGEVTVSVAAGTDWQIVQSGEELDSVFAWNEIPVSYRTTCLGMVFSDASVNLMELVCLDENGEPVLPVNAMQYPALFDEQELYEDGITYQDQTIFDEIYHGRTAYEFLHGLPIYENTHPPLGKTLISVGIAVFGMNPFGWRFICVVFGSLMMPFIYLFGLRLTGKTRYACLAAVLLGTDFMHFTLSRIATIDIIVAFFVLGMFYFMYAFVVSEKTAVSAACRSVYGAWLCNKVDGDLCAVWTFCRFSSLDDRKNQKDRCKEGNKALLDLALPAVYRLFYTSAFHNLYAVLHSFCPRISGSESAAACTFQWRADAFLSQSNDF